MKHKKNVTSYERYSRWLLVGLLTVALISIGTFGVYAFYFMKH
jgi:hypothetical protein